MNIRTFFFILKSKLKYGAAYRAKVALAEPGSKIHLICGGNCSSEENLRLRAGTNLVAIGGTISIGNNVFFNRNCNLVCRKKITIGHNVSIGHNVCIIDHDHKMNASGISSSEYKTDEIIIEDGCWIGANVVILRGTHIGAHSVIGAGCVVKGSIPPHSLVKSDRTLTIKPLKNKQLEE